MNILIFSNDLNIKTNINTFLGNININQITDSSAFLQELFFSNIDLLIIDTEDENITKLIYEIKEDNKTKELPIIFIINEFYFTYFQNLGYSMGEINYLLKPIVNNELLNKIILYQNLIQLQNKSKEIEDFVLQYSQATIQAQMLGIISHQWRQPLNIIATSVINLELKSELEQLKHQDIEKTAQKIHDILAKTTNVILNYEELFIESFTKCEFNASEPYNKCLNLITPQLQSHKIKIENSIPQKPISITSYKNELSQAILSLLSITKDLILEEQKKINGFDGNIKLMLEEKNEQIVFKIINKKIGILNDFFSNRYTLSSLLKRSSNSHDVKLFVAKYIIENKLNGTLEITNHNKDLVFIITI